MGQSSFSSPGHAGVGLGNNAAEAGKHGPAAMDQLALAEALQAEDLSVGGKGVLGDRVAVWGEEALDSALQVLGHVLVVLIDADLQVRTI